MIFDPVLDIERIVSVSRVTGGDWHDPCGQQVVVPVSNMPAAPERVSISRCSLLL